MSFCQFFSVKEIVERDAGIINVVTIVFYRNQHVLSILRLEVLSLLGEKSLRDFSAGGEGGI